MANQQNQDPWAVISTTPAPAKTQNTDPWAVVSQTAVGAPISDTNIPGAPSGLPGVPTAASQLSMQPAETLTGNSNTVSVDPFTGQRTNDPQYNTGAHADIGAGLGDTVDSVVGMIKNLPSSIYHLPSSVYHSLPPVQLHDTVMRTLPIIDAYEQARTSGADVPTAIKAASDVAEKQDGALQAVDETVKAFKKNPTRETAHLLSSAALLAYSMFGGSGVAAEAAPGEGIVTGETEAPGLQMPPTFAKAPGAGELINSGTEAEYEAANALPEEAAPAATSATPVESAASKIAAKSGISEGAAAPTTAEIQAPLQTGLRDVLGDTAQEAGVEPSAASTSSVAEETADAVYAKSKAAYRTLDEASGGRWQRFDDSIKNLSDKMDEVAGVDDEKFDQFAAKKMEVETAQQKMIDDLVKEGKVDPKLAEQAKADYKQAQALYDVDSAAKASTTGRAGIGNGVEITDPKKWSTRLTKLYDSGRLQEATGSADRAAQLMEHAETAKVASQLPATGQNALQELISNSTKQGKVYGTNTDFADALDKFNKMAPEERAAQFGSNAGVVRDFLKTQARNQFFRSWSLRGLAGGAGLVVGKETGLTKKLLGLLL